MPTPQTGLVIEIFSTNTDAAKRIKYWQVKNATVTGPTPCTDAIINDKTSENTNSVSISISNVSNCIWLITAAL